MCVCMCLCICVRTYICVFVWGVECVCTSIPSLKVRVCVYDCENVSVYCMYICPGVSACMGVCVCVFEKYREKAVEMAF